MDHSVQFEDEQTLEQLAIRPPKPLTAGEILIQFRIVNSMGEAMVLLAIFTSLLIGVSIYLLASSVSHTPTLNNDVPEGEHTPLNLKPAL